MVAVLICRQLVALRLGLVCVGGVERANCHTTADTGRRTNTASKDGKKKAVEKK